MNHKAYRVFRSHKDLDVFRDQHSDKGFVFFARELKNKIWKYECWYFDDFVEYYVHALSPTVRSYHEIIEPREPCRLYFDLDSKDSSITLEVFSAAVEELKERVRNVLGESYCSQSPVVLVAHRVDKLSAHVIFPHWFRTPEHCLHVVRTICHSASKELCSMIDMCVYSTNCRKNFRMAYSNKLNRITNNLESPFLPSDKMYPDDQIDIELFLNSFVSTQSPILRDGKYSSRLPSYHDLIEFDDETLRSSLKWLNAKPNLNTSVIDRCVIDDTKRWILRNMSVKRITESYKNGDVSLILQPGIVCPNKSDRHSSNCTYFNFISTGLGYFSCPKCRVRWKFWVNMAYVAKNKESLHQGLGKCDEMLRKCGLLTEIVNPQ